VLVAAAAAPLARARIIIIIIIRLQSIQQLLLPLPLSLPLPFVLYRPRELYNVAMALLKTMLHEIYCAPNFCTDIAASLNPAAADSGVPDSRSPYKAYL